MTRGLPHIETAPCTRFESLLADQLTTLSAAPSSQVDAAIVDAQRALCKLLGMDRSAIWQGEAAAPRVLKLTHLCTLDQIPPVPEGITANGAFPWITQRLLDAETVAIPDVNALPDEAAIDRASLLYYLDKSTLAIPFSHEAPVRGAISFASTTRHEPWSEEVLTHCRLVARVLASVLARKRSEEQLARLSEQLLQAQRVQAVGRLASGIAHDFGHTLQAISGLTQLAIAKSRDDNWPLREVMTATRHASELTRQLLAFGHPDAHPSCVVDLADTLRDCESLIRRVVCRNIELTLDLDLEPAPVWGDATQLRQIVLNLAANARDAMPVGGKLLFALREVEHPGRATELFANLGPGTYFLLVAEDTGDGIAPEHLQRVCEPFFTTKDPNQGSGLGLSVVHDIVTRYGGELRLESQPSQGTRVLIMLPRAEGVPDGECSRSDAKSS